MKENRSVKMCAIGLGGNSMEYGGGCHGSWYLHSPEEIAKHYHEELTEGVLLVDKRPALEGENGNYANAFASPMVDVDMAEGDIDRFGTRYTESDDFMLSALKETGFAPIIQAAEIAAEVAPDLPGPLDFVPIGYFVKWWLERGAVLYRYDGAAFQPI